ncbi:MAG: CHAT domain-containing tetratricopeptide repeat protein [Bacteroidota bacterium]
MLHAQNNLSDAIDATKKIEDHDERAASFEQLIQDTDLTKNTKALGTLFHETGRSYYKLKNYEKVLLYMAKAIDVKQQLGDIEELNKSLFFKAFIFRKLGKISEASMLCEQIISAKKANKTTMNAYQMISEFEADKGDYHQALAYLNDALSNRDIYKNTQFKSQLVRTIIQTYSGIYASDADTEMLQNDLEIVKSNQKIVEESVEIITENPLNLAQVYNNLAVIYDSFKEYELALEFYKKAQNLYRENEYLEDELRVALNLGILYSKQKKHALATEQYTYVLENSDDKGLLANTHNSMGYYLNTTNVIEKLPFLEKAVMTILAYDQKEVANFRLPTLEEMNQTENQQDVLIYLIDLAAHYVQAFHQNNGQTYLYKAKETVFLIDTLVSLLRYRVDAEASKLFWIERGVDMYMLAVEICYLLNDAENAFYFMEKNKALLLQENIKTLQAKLALNVPETWLRREYMLDYEVIDLQIQFQQQPDNDSIQQAFTDKKNVYQRFKDSLQQQYPQYTKTKEKVDIVTLQDILKKYKNTAFVEYILHDTDGYGIFYDGGEPILFKIENTETFQEQLTLLRTFMAKRSLNSQKRKEFQAISFQVFQQVFPLRDALQRLQDKKLIIIADHTLQYIPFEILTTQKEGRFSESYLINRTEILYLQSFSLFEQIQKKQNNPTKKLLAIAPIEFKNTALPTLTDATDIFTFLAKDSTSVLLQKTEATKENFSKYRNDFEIIHLNTHAGLDSISQIPWLAFYDSNILLHELFGLENQAELVVLDACKTDDGVQLSGEGIINLSRGFFFNGTQSVLASQWNVNQQAGNEILQTFYKELENGKAKSKALQIAKKSYLLKHDQTQNIPYYWAAFKLTGSTDAIVENSWFDSKILLISGLIFVCVLVFFYFRKKIFR